MATLEEDNNVPGTTGPADGDRFTRRDPPLDAPEREMLDAFLDYHRATLLQKVAGLDEEQLRRRLVSSATTLLGMVKHLGYVERSWFQIRFAGQDLQVPYSDADPDADFRIEPGETIEGVLAFYRDQVEQSRRIAASAASLDEHARHPDRRDFTLRWIMVHMIEETARHNGHADILRELIDGATGE